MKLLSSAIFLFGFLSHWLRKTSRDTSFRDFIDL